MHSPKYATQQHKVEVAQPSWTNHDTSRVLPTTEVTPGYEPLITSQLPAAPKGGLSIAAQPLGNHLGSSATEARTGSIGQPGSDQPSSYHDTPKAWVWHINMPLNQPSPREDECTPGTALGATIPQKEGSKAVPRAIWGTRGPSKKLPRRERRGLTQEILRLHPELTPLSCGERFFRISEWVHEDSQAANGLARTIAKTTKWQAALDTDEGLSDTKRPSTMGGIRPLRLKLFRPLTGPLAIRKARTLAERKEGLCQGLRPQGPCRGCKWPKRVCCPSASSSARWAGDIRALRPDLRGRGKDPLSAGDVEANPGPFPSRETPSVTIHGPSKMEARYFWDMCLARLGQGLHLSKKLTLLRCGDIHPHPGPERRTPCAPGPSGTPPPTLTSALLDSIRLELAMTQDNRWVLISSAIAHSGPVGSQASSLGAYVTLRCTFCGQWLHVTELWKLDNHDRQGCAWDDACPVEEDHRKTARGDSLQTCGDLEQNPGPWDHDDYQLDPNALERALLSLQCPRPDLDAFASPLNALFPNYWTTTTDALSQNWVRDSPLWANPPFRLLSKVLFKIETEGGHVVLLCPGWKGILPRAWALSLARTRLPKNTYFNHRGCTKMPPPSWPVWVLYINYDPAIPVRPLKRSSRKTLSPRLRRSINLAQMSTGGPVGRERWVYFDASISILKGFSLLTATRLESKTHGDKGRGSLLTCGDVEENPGPVEELTASSSSTGPTRNGRRRRADSERELTGPGPHDPLFLPPPPVDSQRDAFDIDLAHGEPEQGLLRPLDPAGNVSVRITTAAPDVMALHCPDPPPIMEVLQLRITTVRHVPAALQGDVSTALTSAIQRYCHVQSDQALFAVLAFTKLVLRAPRVQGKGTQQAVVEILRGRVKKFLEGHLDILMSELTKEMSSRPGPEGVETRSRKRARTNEEPTDNIRRRIRVLVGEGAPRKALDVLLSSGLHDVANPEVVATLKSLHPAPLERLQSSPWPQAPETTGLESLEDGTWLDLVRSCAGKFPRASAPGPSGLRPSHLQDALRRRGGGLALASALARLCQLWCLGKLPQCHSPL